MTGIPHGATQPFPKPAPTPEPWIGSPMPDARFRPRSQIRAQGLAGTQLGGSGAPPSPPRPPVGSSSPASPQGPEAALGREAPDPEATGGRYTGSPKLNTQQFPGHDAPLKELMPHIAYVAQRQGAAMARLAAPGGFAHVVSFASGEHLFGSIADPRAGRGAAWLKPGN